jgi:hypothetical protein
MGIRRTPGPFLAVFPVLANPVWGENTGFLVKWKPLRENVANRCRIYSFIRRMIPIAGGMIW